MALTPDDAAQRGNQAEQPEPASLEHPVVGLPAQPRRQRQDRLRDLPTPASMAPTISSARVLRAGSGMDSTISSTHLDSVAGKPVSGCGSMASAGVWCNTRNMGPGARQRLRTPFRPP